MLKVRMKVLSNKLRGDWAILHKWTRQETLGIKGKDFSTVTGNIRLTAGAGHTCIFGNKLFLYQEYKNPRTLY
jgi:hypothetical protein